MCTDNVQHNSVPWHGDFHRVRRGWDSAAARWPHRKNRNDVRLRLHQTVRRWNQVRRLSF